MHEEGFALKLLPSGEPVFTWPDGRPMAQAPSPPALAASPIEALAMRHGAEGLEIDEWTTVPGWWGENLDLPYAVNALRRAGDAQNVSAETSFANGSVGERRDRHGPRPPGGPPIIENRAELRAS